MLKVRSTLSIVVSSTEAKADFDHNTAWKSVTMGISSLHRADLVKGSCRIDVYNLVLEIVEILRAAIHRSFAKTIFSPCPTNITLLQSKTLIISN